MPLPVIAIANASTCLRDAQVEATLPALQKQVSTDFKGYWDLDCTLKFLPKNEPLAPGWWQIVVLDNPDQAGALGYHGLASAGSPVARVFANFDIRNGISWTVTLSHELLEMLADPWANWCAIGSDNRVYALEVCDPVQADRLGYEVDGTMVSNFITPAWYEPTCADRLDYRQCLTRELEVAAGGYASIFDPRHGWTQITAKEGGRSLAYSSRRQRRLVWQRHWRNR